VTWESLFDRASTHAVTEAQIRDRLAARRSGDEDDDE
jgi:hypothetical protein